LSRSFCFCIYSFTIFTTNYLQKYTLSPPTLATCTVHTPPVSTITVGHTTKRTGMLYGTKRPSITVFGLLEFVLFEDPQLPLPNFYILNKLHNTLCSVVLFYSYRNLFCCKYCEQIPHLHIAQ